MGQCGGISRCDTQQYVQELQSVGLCGISTWRLPHISELQGLVNYGSSKPAIDAQYFPHTMQGRYITSDPFPMRNVQADPKREGTGLLNVVGFTYGFVGVINAYDESHLYVRLVADK